MGGSDEHRRREQPAGRGERRPTRGPEVPGDRPERSPATPAGASTAEPLRVLFVEDSEADVRLLARRLADVGRRVEFAQVQDSRELRWALGTGSWDLVIADGSVPGLPSEITLGIVRRLSPALPALVVSGHVDQAVVARALEFGARACIWKGDADGLRAAVDTALGRVAPRRKPRGPVSEAERRALDAVTAAVLVQDAGGRIRYANPAAAGLAGATPHALAGRSLDDALGDALAGPVAPGTRRSLLVRPDGSTVSIEAVATPLAGERAGWRLWTVHALDEADTVRAELERQATGERRKTQRMARAVMRIAELVRQLRGAQAVAQAALGAGSPAEFLARTGELLTDPEGVGARRAEIWLIEGMTLVRGYPAGGPSAERLPLDGDDPLARAVRCDEPAALAAGRFVAPFGGRGPLLGALFIEFDLSEDAGAEGAQTVGEVLLGILRSVAGTLGLALENLMLLEDVRKESGLDELTGAYNRRFFRTRLREEVQRTRRHGRPLSLLMIDLDHLKAVNDTAGHAQGDRVLREVARLIQGHCRAEDALCRYGGDEFVLVLPEASLEAASTKAETLRQLVGGIAAGGPPGAGRRISLSIGVATLLPRDRDEAGLLQRADQACYAAKRAGRDRVVVDRGE